MASLNDVMMALGRVQEGVDRLREDFQDEKRMAHESRAVIHRRLDEQVEDIAALKQDVAIAGRVDAQVRDELKALSGKVDQNQKEVAPSIEEWKRMKAIGIGIGGLLAIGGLSLASVIMWAGEMFWNWLRAMLRIP